jgi:hypothetical protein
VIGRRCKNVSRAQALDYGLGYTCGIDVSARDWQRVGGGGQWCQGKSFDTFCPLGPSIETELDPAALTVEAVLNGRVIDDATIAQAEAAASAAVDPQTDIHASADYRRALTGTMVERALLSAGKLLPISD